MKRREILYGGDYNPEQWLKEPEILEKDIAYMKEAKINTVSMGMFSWAVLEPEEGKYQMDWLEERIDLLYRNGISTILSTPSGARPRWLAQAYPEVLRVREDRVRQIFGERHNHCYTSPAYREKTAQINRELVRRFGKHPAVVMWHVSNEYGGECHCPLCQEAFRNWLERKYGTIEALNDAWCTTFWSRRYSSFSQVESPSSIGEWELHGLALDWKRFVTAQTADFARHEIAALKEEGTTQPTTVNLMYDYHQLKGNLSKNRLWKKCCEKRYTHPGTRERKSLRDGRTSSDRVYPSGQKNPAQGEGEIKGFPPSPERFYES